MFCTKMRPASKDTKSVFRSKPGPKPKKIKEEKVPYNKEKTRYCFYYPQYGHLIMFFFLQAEVDRAGGLGGEHEATSCRMEDALKTKANPRRPTLLHIHVTGPASVPFSEGHGSAHGGCRHLF